MRDKIKKILEAGSVGQEVHICGWVRSKRQSKNFAFIAVSDGSSQQLIQLFVDGNSESFQMIKDVQTGTSISAHGVLKESPAKGQRWELDVRQLEIIGHVDAKTFPLQKKGHSLEFLREISHLRPRTNTFSAVFRVRNQLAQAVHRFFSEKGFIWAHTPVLTSSDCEGAGEMFQVTNLNMNKPPLRSDGSVDFKKDFFGKKAHLTVSGQLEAEFLALSMGDVYTFGPTFRAENSNTTRHLSEFWMIEPEMAFATLKDDIQLAEDFLKYCIKDVIEHCPDELAFFEKMYKNNSVESLLKVSQSEFTTISYTEAVGLLEGANKKFEYPVKWGLDLQTEHERYLTDEVFKSPVTVTDYPKEIKSFYMRLNDDGKTVSAMDVLVPGVGELIGGSQREERLGLLVERMQELDIDMEGLQWYLDLRRFGSVPHAGFGVGFERLVMYITGMQNIRDVIMCPRAPKLIDF